MASRSARTRAHGGRQQRAGGIGHQHHVGAVALHEPALLGDLLGRAHVGEHQHADDVHVHLLGQLDVLLGDVGFGDVCGDLCHLGAQVLRPRQVVLGADAR
jgi:hypothetical protein